MANDQAFLVQKIRTQYTEKQHTQLDELQASDAYDAMYGTLFDLIISDIMMPGIDGFEFVKTVRSLNENIPILFMTARDDFAAKLTFGNVMLITNILKLNKLENQQIFPQTEVFDLGEQLRESLLQFEELWEKKGLNIEADIGDGITVRSDRRMEARPGLRLHFAAA